jgi:hypothetical protein
MLSFSGSNLVQITILKTIRPEELLRKKSNTFSFAFDLKVYHCSDSKML